MSGECEELFIAAHKHHIQQIVLGSARYFTLCPSIPGTREDTRIHQPLDLTDKQLGETVRYRRLSLVVEIGWCVGDH